MLEVAHVFVQTLTPAGDDQCPQCPTFRLQVAATAFGKLVDRCKSTLGLIDRGRTSEQSALCATRCLRGERARAVAAPGRWQGLLPWVCHRSGASAGRSESVGARDCRNKHALHPDSPRGLGLLRLGLGVGGFSL